VSSNRICVYCGSSNGVASGFVEAAEELGWQIGRSGRQLVYGGGDNGLMGAVARATLASGGTVVGIIPEFLKHRENVTTHAHELVVVPDMHTRKRMMFERADAFVALPGGVGTLEELVEQLTWVQLGRHTKPVVLADIGGFWRPLLSLFAHMRESGFIRQEFELRYLVAEKIEDVLPMIDAAIARIEKRGAQVEAIDPRF
jgi:uncharacterized protein (TIGR00730 family)